VEQLQLEQQLHCLTQFYSFLRLFKLKYQSLKIIGKIVLIFWKLHSSNYRGTFHQIQLENICIIYHSLQAIVSFLFQEAQLIMKYAALLTYITILKEHLRLILDLTLMLSFKLAPLPQARMDLNILNFIFKLYKCFCRTTMDD
jgi:hypothetical protein